jgi:hypothetical protein
MGDLRHQVPLNPTHKFSNCSLVAIPHEGSPHPNLATPIKDEQTQKTHDGSVIFAAEDRQKTGKKMKADSALVSSSPPPLHRFRN